MYSRGLLKLSTKEVTRVFAPCQISETKRGKGKTDVDPAARKKIKPTKRAVACDVGLSQRSEMPAFHFDLNQLNELLARSSSHIDSYFILKSRSVRCGNSGGLRCGRK